MVNPDPFLSLPKPLAIFKAPAIGTPNWVITEVISPKADLVSGVAKKPSPSKISSIPLRRLVFAK